MIWWHQAWQALWGHPELLDRTLGWYETVEPVAREIARRQGFDGVRWMKMTDPDVYKRQIYTCNNAYADIFQTDFG